MLTKIKQDHAEWTIESFLSNESNPEFDFEKWMADALFSYWLKSHDEQTAQGNGNAK